VSGFTDAELYTKHADELVRPPVAQGDDRDAHVHAPAMREQRDFLAAMHDRRDRHGIGVQRFAHRDRAAQGGLGLDPPSIGKILAFSGILNGLFQVTCFTRAHALWGTKKLFVGGLCCAIPIFALFPVMNALARVYGIGPVAYSAVALQVVWSLGLASCYGM